MWLLLALQLAATALGFAYLWRRQDRLRREVAHLRQALAALEAGGASARRRPRVAEQGAAAPAAADIIPIAAQTPQARAARVWRLPQTTLKFEPDAGSADTMRGLALGALAAAPALGFLFPLQASLLIAAGLGAGAAMMLLGLRQEWRAASWAGVVTAAVWAMTGFVLGAAQAAPISFSVLTALAAGAGLAHAHARRIGAGAAMALSMAAAALVLASQVGAIGPAGGAFGVIVAAAAIVGARSLRLEPIHFAAFGAALIGLFVLSGQDAAAIWFTPAATWAGVLFLAIAAVRVPQLGARGVALAGLGALGPMLAIGALHLAQHGLTDHFAAAGAYVGLALALAGVLAAAAARRAHGVTALKYTLWTLAGGAFAALSAAILLAAPTPLAAPTFAALAAALILLDHRAPALAWRAFACLSGLFAAIFALTSAHMLLSEAPGWPPWALTALGLAAPAALLAISAALSHRADAPVSAGLFESLAIGIAVAAANVLVRLFFADGAPLLHPIGFVEAGAHISVWLAASLLIAARARRGAKAARMAAAVLLLLMALLTVAFAGLLWLTPYWSARGGFAGPVAHAPFGFLAPAVLLWVHWTFWRARGAETRGRAAFAAASMLSAAFVTMEAAEWPDAPDWVAALAGATAFALAIVGNFTPGVVAERRRRRSSHGEENLHRQRRRQQRA